MLKRAANSELELNWPQNLDEWQSGDFFCQLCEIINQIIFNCDFNLKGKPAEGVQSEGFCC